MARAKTATVSKSDRVPLTIPRGDLKGDPNFFISINGQNYVIPRGKPVQVPVEVAEEYYRSEKAKEAFYALSDELLENTK